MKKISLSRPFIEEHTVNDVLSVIKSGWLTQGYNVSKFEDLIKKKLRIKYALALNSATSGLQSALISLKISKDDEVIVPSFSWVATANAVELCGARPIFVDIELNTLNADINQILEKVTQNTKAIIVVHLFGKPFDICKLKSLLPRDIPIIEDAACALGASVNDLFCGTMGEVGVFSFHPRKSITTGEGGMVITNCKNIYKYINMLRNHGQDCTSVNKNPYDMFDCPIAGFNFRMTDFQAVLGISQFQKLNAIINYRKILVNIYNQKLSNSNIFVLPREEKNEQHAWQSYVIQVPSTFRNIFMTQLKTVGIETRPGTHAIHSLSYYKKKYQFFDDDFKNTHQAFISSIALPLHNSLSAFDIEYISDHLLRIANDL